MTVYEACAYSLRIKLIFPTIGKCHFTSPTTSSRTTQRLPCGYSANLKSSQSLLSPFVSISCLSLPSQIAIITLLSDSRSIDVPPPCTRDISFFIHLEAFIMLNTNRTMDHWYLMSVEPNNRNITYTNLFGPIRDIDNVAAVKGWFH